MEKYCEIGKNQLKCNAWPHILIALGMLLLSPLVLGIRNLDEVQSARVLETYVALIGIILFTPVFLPEQNKDIRDLIASKYTKLVSIYGVRIFLSTAVSVLLIFGYIQVMKQGNCVMEAGKYFWGTVAEAVAFGGLGIFAYAASDNIVIGYMTPLMYYTAAVGAGEKYLKVFYPFGMAHDFKTKYWILAGGIILAAAGILLRNRKN